MKLSTLNPGDVVIDQRGDRQRLLAHDVQLPPRIGERAGTGWRLPDEVAADLGITVAAGNGGRGVPHGSLFVEESWTCGEAGSTFNLFSTGHDLKPVDTFVGEWNRGQRTQLNLALRDVDPAKWSCVAVPHPDVYVDDVTGRPQTGWFGRRDALRQHVQLEHLVVAAGEKFADHFDLPWLFGPLDEEAFGHGGWAVVTIDGERRRVEPRCLIPDPTGVNLASLLRNLDAETVQPHTARIEAVLVQVARRVEAGRFAEHHISTRLDEDGVLVTLPLVVLEAIILGDPEAAEVLDDGAILRDVLAEVRAARAEAVPS